MTRTAIYSLQDNSLTEQPTMEKEICLLGIYPCTVAGRKRCECQEYNAHVAGLRTIPCHESARSLWKDGQKVVDGKDYEVREEPIPYFDHIDDPVEYRTRAYPIVPVKSEDDLWEKAIEIYHRHIFAGHKNAIAEVKQKFIINKR